LTPSSPVRPGPPPPMRVAVVACSGRELAALDADPSWRLRDVLAGLPQHGGSLGGQRRLFLGGAELCGAATLADAVGDRGHGQQRAHSGVNPGAASGDRCLLAP
ncbi:unnamed protein product, partial [Prorocentrum cordatum]